MEIPNSQLEMLLSAAEFMIGTDTDSVPPIKDVVEGWRQKIELDEYVKHDGSVCPRCGSHFINSLPFESFDDGTVKADCWCKDCDAKWTDTYQLVEANYREE